MEIKVQKVLQHLFAVCLLNHTLTVAPSRLFSLANSSITPCDGYLLSLYKASRAIFCKCENFVLLFAVDEAARFLFPVKQDLQDFQIQGKMRLTQIKESQTKKKWYKKARKVSFVRSIIDDE